TGEAPTYTYLPTRDNTLGPRPGESQCVPFKNPDYPQARGFGRFTTITEAAVQFYCSKVATDADGKIIWNNKTAIPQKMRAGIILEPFNPAPGPPVWSHHVRFRLTYGPLQYAISGQGGQAIPFLSNTPGGTAENLVTSRSNFSGFGGTTALMGLKSFFRC